MKTIVTLGCLLLGFQLLIAQSDTLKLKEAILSVSKPLSQYSIQNEQEFQDSILKKNQPSLTSLLKYNSVISFKENGAGMVSSPSFRGTTASQTTVLWNGVNINSQTTGQTDFNTVNILGFDKILVKAGGGNVAENNSSIGGSVELINDIKFNNSFTNDFLVRYGSFNMFNGNFKSDFSTNLLNVKVGVSRYSSDNDFDYPEKYHRKNSNGQFYHTNLSIASAYKLNTKNTLQFFGNIFQGRRNLSVITPYATKSKYEDYNTRSMLNWMGKFRKFKSDLKVAYLTEEYRYFSNIENENFDSGEVNTLITKYDLAYHFNSNFQLQTNLEYTRNEGFSGKEMDDKTRNLGSIGLSVKHKILPKFYYEISLRQELSETYGNPLLYSFGGNWAVTNFYNLKFNTSKNFRIPTYNDLYWPEVGNSDLKPETSYQAEIGNEFHTKNVHWTVTAYYNTVKDLIRWTPNTNLQGGILWRPENVNDVNIYGVESIFSYNTSFKKHNLSFTGIYAYTVSENQEIKKQLAYVPFHKVTTSFNYNWKGISLLYQFLFNGSVYTTTQNEETYKIPSYFISNLGLDYGFGESKMYKIGFEILNLFDYEYESVLNRPMPKRSFNVYINFKI
ncbi:MAG: TonB-dependent receptor plug domain-containing protein [Moheibacter sp.]